MKKEMVIDKLEELYDQIQRVEHDQMEANGVQRAIEVINNMQDGDTERERMEQANEILNLRLENEYLRMRLAEIRDKVNQMEPPEGFPPVYNHAYHDAVEEIRRIVE